MKNIFNLHKTAQSKNRGTARRALIVGGPPSDPTIYIIHHMSLTLSQAQAWITDELKNLMDTSEDVNLPHDAGVYGEIADRLESKHDLLFFIKAVEEVANELPDYKRYYKERREDDQAGSYVDEISFPSFYIWQSGQ